MIVSSITQLRTIVQQHKKSNKKVALVPTMGYLHQGHLSLIESAKKENDIVVVSVFVNPTQFAPNEDFDAYPRDIERDSQMAYQAGADLIFHPDVAEMYPSQSSTFIGVEGDITTVLCGTSRPTHFKGVTTVVGMLFNIVQPHTAYFGQKDAQQAAILQKMVKELHFDIQMHICPIVREKDGLAMSSRNIYLTQAEREQAVVLNQSLSTAQKQVEKGEKNVKNIKESIKKEIEQQHLATIDYVEIYAYPSLQPITYITQQTIIALAVRFGKTRLIDNIILG